MFVFECIDFCHLDFQGNGRKQRTGPLLPASDPPGARGLNVFSKACSSSKPPWGRSSRAKTPGALEAEENCTCGDTPENESRAP